MASPSTATMSLAVHTLSSVTRRRLSPCCFQRWNAPGVTVITDGPARRCQGGRNLLMETSLKVPSLGARVGGRGAAPLSLAPGEGRLCRGEARVVPAARSGTGGAPRSAGVAAGSGRSADDEDLVRRPPRHSLTARSRDDDVVCVQHQPRPAAVAG